jgi:hypothetical protein
MASTNTHNYPATFDAPDAADALATALREALDGKS